MYVPDEVRKSVVFLGYKNMDGMYEFAGTGFFVSRIIGKEGPTFIPSQGRGFSYLVTAKHVIDGIRDKNADMVGVRVNFRDGQARWVETDLSAWLFHPTESDSVDVAVMRVTIPPEVDHTTSPYGSCATEEIIKLTNIGTGDEVFLAGLFANHYGTRKNIPIVRVGNIAAMPEEPVEVRRFGLMDAYLIEARSLGGLSGSPVFVHIPADRAGSLLRGLGFTPSGTVFFLLGLMHGHWDEMYTEPDAAAVEDAGGLKRVNMGIAIVVPVTKIMEVINQPMISKKEEEIIKAEKEKRLPTTDSLEGESGLTQESFEEALRRASCKASSQPESESGET
jgi:hypothetical protein